VGLFLWKHKRIELKKRAYDYFRQIDELGGVLPAIDKGFFQSEIADAAYQYQREIDEGRRKIVGVNAYSDQKRLKIPLLDMNPEGYLMQKSRLDEVRRIRDNGRLGQLLDRLRIACEGTENTMPFIIDAVRADATLGEIMQVMKEVFGVYEEPIWV